MKIDLHTHILPREWSDLDAKYGYSGFMRLETVWEWFQWLAEQMIEREKKSPPRPAHLAHRSQG